MPRSGFQHLHVWQEAVRLAVATRTVCQALERSRRWHLRDQLARAATSVHANIAEGNGRDSPRDRLRFHTIAWASLLEVEALLVEVAADEALAPLATRCHPHVRRTTRLLAALRRSLRRPDPSG
jgi:four helix bundle protein